MFALFHGCHGCSKSVQSSIARKMFVSRFEAFDFPQYLRFSPAFRLAHLPIDRQFAFRIDFWYARRLNFKIFNELVILRSHSLFFANSDCVYSVHSFACNYDLTVYFSFLFFSLLSRRTSLRCSYFFSLLPSRKNGTLRNKSARYEFNHGCTRIYQRTSSLLWPTIITTEATRRFGYRFPVEIQLIGKWNLLRANAVPLYHR